MTEPLLDAAGRRRSPATMPGFRAGRPPRNKGVRYPADPPTVEEVVAVMRAAGDGRHGRRLRVLSWCCGVPACASTKRPRSTRPTSTIAAARCSFGAVRAAGAAKSASTRGWQQRRPWLTGRLELPVGPLFCVINGRTRGRPWSSAAARAELRRTAAAAGVRRRFAPHQLRHAHAIEMAHEGVPLIVIQAPTRPQQPRHHLDLPPRHRQRRDHRHRPRAPSADDPGQHIAKTLRARPGQAPPAPLIAQRGTLRSAPLHRRDGPARNIDASRFRQAAAAGRIARLAAAFSLSGSRRRTRPPTQRHCRRADSVAPRARRRRSPVRRSRLRW
jgi:hypothetical protein